MNAPLPISLLLEIDQLKAGWMFVGAAFQRGSPHCEECPYFERRGQMLPYGEGSVEELYDECTLGQKASHKPQDCPALAAHLEEQTEEQ